MFFGDIVGSSGRKALARFMPELLKEHQPDLVVANAENAAHGFGLTMSTANEIFDCGVDIITGGNHIWDKKEVTEVIKEYESRFVRPANYPKHLPGKGFQVVDTKRGDQVAIFNVMGRIFMNPLDCPFAAMDQALESVPEKVKVRFVDIHAEASSEKAAMSFYLDGRVSAVVGTHTHVATADECIRENGTAFLTDAGMTGPIDSIIGMDKKNIIKRFVDAKPARIEVAEGKGIVQGCLIKIDPSTGKAKNIERVKRSEA